MIALQTDTIHNGQSPTYLQGGDYLTSLGIDPDANVSSAINKIAGTVTPTAYSSFVGIDGNPMWTKTNPKNTNTLTYTDEGKVYGFNKAQTALTSPYPLTLTNASGNGMAYYNNYYYFIKDNNIDRLNPATNILEPDWWTSIKSKEFVQESTRAFESTFNFGDGQTYDSVAQYLPGATLGSVVFNRLSLEVTGSVAMTLRVRVRRGGSTTEPTGTVVETANFNITTTKQRVDIVIPEVGVDSALAFWLEIDKEGGFGTGEFVTIRSGEEDTYPTGAVYGYTGSAWEIPSDFFQKNLAFKIYNETQTFTGLQNTTYPANGDTDIPNHPCHVHLDDALYVADFSSDRGRIHKIDTLDVMYMYGDTVPRDISVGQVIQGRTSKATAEVFIVDNGFAGAPKNSTSTRRLVIGLQKGEFIIDEDIISVNSLFLGKVQEVNQGKDGESGDVNVLSLPIGMKPVAIESFGTDLAILAIESSDDDVNQGEARLYLWDTFDITAYREVKLPYPNATALLSHNGIPFIWGGDNKGYSFSRYVGGDSVQDLYYIDGGKPPFAGAVTSDNHRVLWGTNSDYPLDTASVLAWGSRNTLLPVGLHNVAKVAGGQVTSLITGTKNADGLIIGSNDMVSKYGGTLSSVFRTKLRNVGKNFTLKQLTIPLARPVNANTQITVKVYMDNESRSKDVIVINNANYGGKDKVVIYPEATGETNYFVEFTWGLTEPMPILLPITEGLEVLEE